MCSGRSLSSAHQYLQFYGGDYDRGIISDYVLDVLHRAIPAALSERLHSLQPPESLDNVVCSLQS